MTMASAERARLGRRLAASYKAGCWIGVISHAIDARERIVDGAPLTTPDHYLGAAWAPADGPPQRYPDVVVIGSPAADNALAELLAHVPAQAKLWLAGRHDVDIALAAEILLTADRNLECYQREALATLVARERARTQSEIAARYTDRDAGFERFRTRVVGSRLLSSKP